ncbi:MAG: tryptophan-rich sensory protein [Boseongicola sp.]|nr:tryptophan-rich sensory protein [Boseongicola sp.]
MDWLLFAIFLASTGAAATTGVMFEPGQWYDQLEKPSWNPPKWLFPLAWTILYIAMSVAAARVAPQSGSAYALAFFALQIALNTLWTPIFFGLRRMRAAFIVIIFLWLAVAACLALFWQIDLIAGLLFAPYLMWVSAAGALNYSVWQLNKDVAPV